MNWVEYKLENNSVIEVPYNIHNVAPVPKKILEQLINTVNVYIRQVKILEHIKTIYADGMSEQYDKGRADAIQDIRVEIANRVPSRPMTKRAIEVWEDKYWLLINLDKKLEQMQKGTENV